MIKQVGRQNSLKLFKEKIKDVLRESKRVKRKTLIYLRLGSALLCFLVLLVFLIADSSGNDNDYPLLVAVSKVFTKNNNDEFLFVGPQPCGWQSPDFYLVQKSAVKGTSSPSVFSPQVLGSLSGEILTAEDAQRKEVIEHIVQEGDTLAGIADRFNISLNTLLWTNNISKNSKLRIGQRLIILPVSGVLHEVKSGDTLSKIAKNYKSETLEIIAFNELKDEEDLLAGDILIIPNGTMPSSSQQQPVFNSVPLASNYFIVPVSSPYIITQGLHWYNAIDFSHAGNSCGRPVFVAAGGTVQKTGYQNVSGNYVRILHPNGVITFYGHLSSILVSPGQQVSQGEMIGYIGNTGYTVGRTGCHLHFEVRGARNPFAY